MFKIKEKEICFKSSDELFLLKESLNEYSVDSTDIKYFSYSFIQSEQSDKNFIVNWENKNKFSLTRQRKLLVKIKPLVLLVGEFIPNENKLIFKTIMPITTFIYFLFFLLIGFPLIVSFAGIFVLLLWPLSIIIYFLLLVDESDSTINALIHQKAELI